MAAPQQPGQAARSTTLPPLAAKALMACACGFTGSVLGGVFAYTTGRQQLYKNMIRARMIIIATGIGLYTTATGWIPPPQPMTAAMGRPPRPPLVDPIFTPRPPTPSH